MWWLIGLAMAQVRPETDPLTVTAIALTTYATTALVHEGDGHQLASGGGGGAPQG